MGNLFFNSKAYSQEETEPPDESDLFNSVAPDALIVLDLSGSMNWTPVGEVMYTHSDNQCDSSSAPFYGESGTGHTKACDISTSWVPNYSDATCSGTFYRSSDAGHTTDCSRLAIAKRAIFDILDENDDNTIDSADEQNLNIRFGYMRFYDCPGDDTGESYSSGCNYLVRAIGSKYSRIYCNSTTSCSSSSSASGSVSGATASGETPLASALHEAKLYLEISRA